MIDDLASWANSPVVQSLILSPLIGAIMGAVLTALVQPAPAQNQTVQQANIIFITQYREVRSRRSSNSDDGYGIIAVAALGVLAITWAYARYAQAGIDLWIFLTLTLLSFNFAAALVATFKQELLSHWILYILTPMAALGFSLWLASEARDGVVPGAAEAAARHGMVQFYMNALNQEHRFWLATQAAGVLSGVVATLLSGMRLTYYVALSNQRGHGKLAHLWRRIAGLNRLSAGGSGFFAAAICYGISFFCLTGAAYRFLLSS